MMKKEIERKFLVEDLDVLMETVNSDGASISKILQSYVSDETRLRVEFVDTCEGHESFYYLTIKLGKGLVRKEYEFEIPEEEGKFLLVDLQKAGKKQVSKTRYLFEHRNMVFELDVFMGANIGLSILEVELDNEEDKFELPHGIGPEITGISRYYNANLAENPFSNREEEVKMNREEIQQKVIEIVAVQFGIKVADIVLDTSFINDLNADSLDTVEVVMCIEDRFDFQVPDEDAEKLSTVGMAVDYVEKKLADESSK